jgi:hypothetical protein
MAKSRIGNVPETVALRREMLAMMPKDAAMNRTESTALFSMMIAACVRKRAVLYITV